MMPTIKTTLSDVVDAIELNGYPKARGQLIRYQFSNYVFVSFDPPTDGKILAACAIGQGSLNLECTVESLDRALGQITFRKKNGEWANLHWFITRLNDNTGAKPADIARKIRELPNWESIKDTLMYLEQETSYTNLTNYQGKRVESGSV